MVGFAVMLFRKFSIQFGGQEVNSIRVGKVQELFSYLVISGGRPHSREFLSELLWEGQPPARSKKNLRQTLWRLQAALKETRDLCELELLVDSDWIQLNLPNNFWLDTREFERTFKWANNKRARELTGNDFDVIRVAVDLYQGDLLEGWYQDWCVFERERFQTMYLMLLDKLVQYCEVQGNYDIGLIYGAEILRQDRAYERTHRQMMRLYYMAGDRTQALHQYRRCVGALRKELDIEPSQRTKQLYEQIRSDTFTPPLFALAQDFPSTAQPRPALHDALKRLEQFSETLNRIELQVKQEINALGSALSEKG
jgi:DNA-binding SARP family transcriptional activator